MQFKLTKKENINIYEDINGFNFKLETKRKLNPDDIDSIFLYARELAKKAGGSVKGNIEDIKFSYKEPNPWKHNERPIVPKKNLWKMFAKWIKSKL